MFLLFSNTVEKIKQFSLAHFGILAVLFLIAALVILFIGKRSEKTYKIFAFVLWIIISIFEILKQIYYWNGSYNWGVFPFQFCSTILYALPFIFILKKDTKIYRSFQYFLATYIFFAGTISIILLDSIITKDLFINIQTLIHHGSQTVLGALTLYRLKNHLNIKDFLGGTIIFIITVIMALILNELAHTYIPNEYFNMFYINRHDPRTFVLLGKYHLDVVYPIFLLGYIFGFSFIAYLIYLIDKLLYIIKKHSTKE